MTDLEKELGLALEQARHSMYLLKTELMTAAGVLTVAGFGGMEELDIVGVDGDTRPLIIAAKLHKIEEASDDAFQNFCFAENIADHEKEAAKLDLRFDIQWAGAMHIFLDDGRYGRPVTDGEW